MPPIKGENKVQDKKMHVMCSVAIATLALVDGALHYGAKFWQELDSVIFS